MSRCKLSYILLISLCHFPLALSAQDKQSPIAPYLTDTTIAFARIRLDQLDLEPVKKLSREYVQGFDEQLQQIDMMISTIQGIQKQFVDAGVTDLYIVVELEHIFQGPYLLLDYRDGADVEQVTTLLREIVPQINVPAIKNYQDLNGVLFAGDEQILSHIQAGHIAERPHLADALKEVDSDPVQLVICPSLDQTRAIREAVPTFPAPFQQLNGDVLAGGVQYLSAGIHLEPDPGFRIIIQSESDEIAQLMLNAEQEALSLITKMVLADAPFPGLEMLANKLQMRREKDRLLLEFSLQPNELDQLKTLLTNPLEGMREQASASRSVNNLKQFELAMHNWHDKYNVFPAHANYDKEGKPLLSWRVHVLPYLDQQELYTQFHLDEHWDSEHNRQFISQMPQIFAVPDSAVSKAGKTGYVFPILKDGSGITDGTKAGIQLQEITDGTSNTAMIVVSDDEHSVIWTKPDDLVVDPEKPLAGLRLDSNGLFQAAFADGSVHRILNTIDPKVWLGFLTRAGGEVVELP